MAKKKIKKVQTTAMVVVKEKKYEVANVGEMNQMAVVLKSHIVQNELFTEISGKKYAHVDGWAFAGAMMGILPEVIAINDLSKDGEYKWSCEVVLRRIKDEKIVGRGFAMCSNKESKKKTFDEYAVLSMAQTRAIGKAYRNLIGWVMKLSGYEGTPSEEIIRAGETPKEASSEDVYRMAQAAARGAKTTDALHALLERVQESKKLNAKQKKDLEILIGGMIDKLDQ